MSQNTLARHGAASERRSFFQELRDNIWFLVAVLASLALSALSFRTTWYGMSGYLGEPAFTLLGTFGIQALLFIISWLVAFALWDRAYMRAIGFFVIFLIGAAVSITFSFVSLYSEISKSDDRAKADDRRARTEVRSVLTELRNEMVATETGAYRSFTDDDGFRQWRVGAEKVVDQAVSIGPQIQKIVQANQEELRRRVTEAGNRLRALKEQEARAASDLREAETELASNAKRLSQAEAEFEPLDRKVQELRERVKKNEELAELERSGVGTTTETFGRGGCGPECKRYLGLADAAREELTPLEITHGSLESTVRTRRERNRALEAQQAEAQADLAAARQKLKVEEENRRNLDNELGVDVAVAAGSLDEIVASFRDELAQFEQSRDIEHVAKAQSICNLLLGTMANEPRIQDQIRTLSCDEGGFGDKLSLLGERNEQLAEFDRACPVETQIVDDKAVSPLAGLSMAQAVELGDRCIEQSRLPSSVTADLSERLFRLVQSRTDSPLERAYLALFVDREAKGYVAMTIAVVIDLMVLLVALGGRAMQTQQRAAQIREKGYRSISVEDDEGDPADIRGLKTFLRQIEIGSNRGRKVNTTAPWFGEQPNAKEILVWLETQGHAKQDPADPTTYLVDSAGYLLLREELAKLQSAGVRRSGPGRWRATGDPFAGVGAVPSRSSSGR